MPPTCKLRSKDQSCPLSEPKCSLRFAARIERRDLQLTCTGLILAGIDQFNHAGVN